MKFILKESLKEKYTN